MSFYIPFGVSPAQGGYVRDTKRLWIGQSLVKILVNPGNWAPGQSGWCHVMVAKLVLLQVNKLRWYCDTYMNVFWSLVVSLPFQCVVSSALLFVCVFLCVPNSLHNIVLLTDANVYTYGIQYLKIFRTAYPGSALKPSFLHNWSHTLAQPSCLHNYYILYNKLHYILDVFATFGQKPKKSRETPKKTKKNKIARPM